MGAVPGSRFTPAVSVSSTSSALISAGGGPGVSHAQLIPASYPGEVDFYYFIILFFY